MTRINLLPWREEAKKTKLVRFGLVLGLSLGFTLILIMIIHVYYGSLLSTEESRNAYLQTELNNKQTEFTALNNQKQQVSLITKQLKFLTTMRLHSYQAVALMQVLPQVTPSDLILKKVMRDRNTVTIEGVASSDLQVTLFIKALGSQKGFEQPVLTQINAVKDEGAVGRAFQIKVVQQDMNE